MAQRREASNGGETQLRDELAQLRADIDGLIGTVGRLADSAGHELIAGAKRTMSGAEAQADRVYHQALDEGRRTLKTTEKTIRAHPYLSIAVAAGIGWLIGKLMTGRE